MSAKQKEVKLNILALNRRSKALMCPFVTRDGYKFISSDAKSAEPTLILNYSEDPVLKAILFDYTNRPPEWKDGLLMSDSLYVTTMSKTELLRPVLKILPPSWYPLWVSDNEAAKAALGATYRLAKIAVLAMLYGLSPNGLVRQFSENGVTLSLIEAERIHNSFWSSIPQVRELRDVLVKCFTAKFRKKVPFLTPFGFPAPSGKPKDAMNRVIQSSVSSFIRALWEHMFPNQIGAELVCVIHDEIIAEVPEDNIELYRVLLNDAVDSVNQKFELKYPMRLGFNIGNNLYEIH